ncbi:MAG TPA: lipid-binding SYLF domain-containing protein [Bryobacteraceae bacterium]|nr:lipid-binding SYLF domain-containing protein [Bryobacteraceae bacterium]
METPDRAIPQELLDRAHCSVIVPGLKRGFLIFGARYGKGYVSCRNKSRVGWTAPGTVRIEGVSFGPQVGGSETDVILLAMNERGMERLLSSQFMLGVGTSVAAGVFAGVSLEGTTLRQDVSDNGELYGRTLEDREIIEKELQVPGLARRLISSLDKYSGRQGSPPVIGQGGKRHESRTGGLQ